MLCSCSTHPVTKKRDHVTVLKSRVTERHSRTYCARTTYLAGHIELIGKIERRWVHRPAPMKFERLDR